jgi:hypothetical protein
MSKEIEYLRLAAKHGMQNCLRELNRRETFPGSDQIFEPESARQLRNIIAALRGLAVQGEAVYRDLSNAIGQKPPKNSAVRRLFAEEIPNPAKITAEICRTLDGLADNPSAYRAGQAIVTLYLSGGFARLRNCPRCRRFVFADRGNRRYCSDSCRNLKWQITTGRKSHRRSYRKWWLKAVGLPAVEGKLRDIAKDRPLSKLEEARKQRYLAKRARYLKEAARLEKKRQAKGEGARAYATKA